MLLPINVLFIIVSLLFGDSKVVSNIFPIYDIPPSIIEVYLFVFKGEVTLGMEG